MIRRWVLNWLAPRHDYASAREIEFTARLNALDDQTATHYAVIAKLQNKVRRLESICYGLGGCSPDEVI